MKKCWLILLHGLGGSESSLEDMAKYCTQQIPSAETVLLQGPQNVGSDAYPAYGWFDPPSDRHRALHDPLRKIPHGLARSVTYVHETIGDLVSNGARSEDIHLIGHSQGGATAITSGLLHGERLGSVSTIAGYLALDGGMDPQNNGTLFHLHHSQRDGNVSVEWAHYTKKYIDSIELRCDVRIWDFADDPHGIHWPQVDAICQAIVERMAIQDG